MKNLTKISKKAAKFLELSGYDVQSFKKELNKSGVKICVCECKHECDEHGVDYSYPYFIINSFNV